MIIKLYWSPRSRSFSTLWLMEESGLPHERVLRRCMARLAFQCAEKIAAE